MTMIYRVRANEGMFDHFRKLEEELQIKHLLSTVVQNDHFLQKTELDNFVKETKRVGRDLYEKQEDAIVAQFYIAVAELIEYIKIHTMELRTEEEFHDFRTNMCEFYRSEPEHVCSSQMNPVEGANSCQMQHCPLLSKTKKEMDGVELIANKLGVEMSGIAPAIEAVQERYEKERQEQPNPPGSVTLSSVQKDAEELCLKHGWDDTWDHRFRYLSEEFGEVAKVVNQLAIHGSQEELKEQLGSELFDLIWNAAALANVYGIDLEKVAAAKVHENGERTWPEPVARKESLLEWAKRHEGGNVKVVDEYRTNSVGDYTAEGSVENHINYIGTLSIENDEIVIKPHFIFFPDLKIQSNYTNLETSADRATLYWLDKESDGKFCVKVLFLRAMPV